MQLYKNLLSQGKDWGQQTKLHNLDKTTNK